MVEVTSRNINLVDEVAARIKASSIGTFISDEDLYGIVKQGLDKALFEKVPGPTDGMGRVVRYEDPAIVVALREQFKTMQEQMFKKYLADRDDEIKKLIETEFAKAVENLTGMKLLELFLAQMLQGPLQAFRNNLQQDLYRLMQNMPR